MLPLTDPHGLRVALVENARRRRGRSHRGRTARFRRSGRFAVSRARGCAERDLAPTTAFLTSVLGFELLGRKTAGIATASPGGLSGAYVDVQEAPDTRRGAWGVGSIHHLAWRVDDAAHQLAVRDVIEAAGRRPTPVIDRFWFQSVYFLEPGGVLFELATDGPGFAVDEDPAHLGESLVLPPWLEGQRAQITAALPAAAPARACAAVAEDRRQVALHTPAASLSTATYDAVT